MVLTLQYDNEVWLVYVPAKISVSWNLNSTLDSFSVNFQAKMSMTKKTLAEIIVQAVVMH